MTAVAKLPTVDELAQEIRRVDGNHSLGAGALAEALMPFLALSPAELGGVVTFDVVREVVKARTRLGFASPEGQEEQAARAIELIRELCEEVVSLNSASWVAEVITVTEPGDKGVRIRWRGGFPQVGDKLYTTPRAAEAVTDGDALFLLECADTLAKDFRHHMADKLREFVKQKALTPPSAKGE